MIHTVRPSNGGFVAEWEYVAAPGEEPERSRGEEFASYADALRYLEDNFDEPLASTGS